MQIERGLMATNITANPWYIDTAGTGLIWTGKIYIKDLIWNKPTPGGALIILDQNGNVIINTIANASDAMFSFGTLSWVNGMSIPTMASGTLSIFITK